MYTINAARHNLTLEAININDKLNTNKKNVNETFEYGTKIYWLLSNKDFDSAIFSRAAVRFFEKLNKEINVDINSFLKSVDSNFYQQIITSLLSASELYNNKLSYKTSNKQNKITNNFIINGHEEMLKQAKIIVDAETWSKNMIEMPSNFLSADVFEKYIKQQLKQLGSKIKISVLHKKELQAKKMGLLLAVGQASTIKNEPRLVVIEYKNANTPKIALVGKGILHDTGGLNLKPTSAMANMHGDMTGAAIVTGLVYALAKSNVKTNVTIIAPLTSNEINDRSFRANDVLHSYDGKTVEITNTDAEGRLILADGISYAIKDAKATSVISIATLTGAIVVALGSVFAGYWTNNTQLVNSIETAAKRGCESVWQMPFHNEFLKSLDSRVADYINCSESRNGSAIVAAEFLKIFAKDKDFIHFDIAGSNELKTTFLPSMLRTLFYFLKGDK